MVWYAKVSQPKLLPPVDGFHPNSANREQLIAEEHAREMLDTLELIRDCIQIADQTLDKRDELDMEDLLEALS